MHQMIFEYYPTHLKASLGVLAALGSPAMVGSKDVACRHETFLAKGMRKAIIICFLIVLLES